MEREGTQRERNKGEKESADATSPRLTSRSRDVSVYMCIRMCVCVQARITARGKESKATEFCLFPVSGPPGSYGVSRGGQYLHITSSWRGTTVVDIRSCYAVCYLLANLVSRCKKNIKSRSNINSLNVVPFTPLRVASSNFFLSASFSSSFVLLATIKTLLGGAVASRCRRQ